MLLSKIRKLMIELQVVRRQVHPLPPHMLCLTFFPPPSNWNKETHYCIFWNLQFALQTQLYGSRKLANVGSMMMTVVLEKLQHLLLLSIVYSFKDKFICHAHKSEKIRQI
jgi:hypothetical protein